MTNLKFTSKPLENSFNTFVDDLLVELPAFFRTEFNTNGSKGFVPVNVKETDKSYQLKVVAPDFKVNLDQNLLTISAEKDTSASLSANPQVKQIRREYSYPSFKRSFTLDEKIDATNIGASYINGVLTLNLPKKEVVKASATEIVVQ